MHEIDEKVHWHEPKAGENAGLGKFQRKPMPYDLFMEAEGIPCYRGIGVHRVQDLPMKPWARLGGKGTYIQLYGTEGLWGMYVVEIPGAGALNVEHHLYEKVCLVVEGRGSTEIWLEGQNKKPHLRVAEGIDVHDPAQRLSPFHQCSVVAGADAVRHLGAERDEPRRQSRTSCSTRRAYFTERFSGADDFFTPKRRCRARSGAWPRDAAYQHRTGYRRHANCRSITGARPAIAVSSR